MVDLLAVVEGRSEKAFLDRVVAPYLGGREVFLRTTLVGKPGHKGGTRSWLSVRGDLVRHLQSNKPTWRVFVTTMFDYFRMPSTGQGAWPGRQAAGSLPHDQKAPRVEMDMHADLCRSMGSSFDPRLFVPYVQMHELEALLFASITALERAFPEQAKAIATLSQSTESLEPEEINDSPQSAPSKRIINLLPEYGDAKVRAVEDALSYIGLPALRARCPHFGQWIRTLETLCEAPA